MEPTGAAVAGAGRVWDDVGMATRYLREEGATLRSRPMLVLVVLVELVLAGLLERQARRVAAAHILFNLATGLVALPAMILAIGS